MTRRTIAEDGVFLVLQYSVFVRKTLNQLFGAIEQRWSPINVPPAFLFRVLQTAPGRPGVRVSALSWQAARSYVLVPGTLGTGLLLARRVRLGLPVLGLAGAIALFFRDPERPLPDDPALVYAAADGVVRGVDDGVIDDWLPSGPAVRISVFLSLLNVHVNRSPVTATVTATEEIDGGFAPAFADRSEVGSGLPTVQNTHQIAQASTGRPRGVRGQRPQRVTARPGAARR